MICRYVYRTTGASKQLVGCVVLTDEGKLGYSAVHPKDRRKITKKLARTIAMGRAEKCNIYEDPASGGWFVKQRTGTGKEYWVPTSIGEHLAALARI